MIKWTVQERLRESLSDILPEGCSADQIICELPKNKTHGDFATNISFLLSPLLRKNPRQIAEELTERLAHHPVAHPVFQAAALNGFINLTLNADWLWAYFLACKKPPVFPEVTQKTLVEYVSANPTGPLHIGHGRMAVIGDSLFRLLQAVRHPVENEFYINDAGVQIQNFLKSVDASRHGAPIPADGYHGHYIADIAKISGDPVAAMIQAQKDTLKRLGIQFNVWFSERTLHAKNEVESVIALLRKADVVEDKDGAVWFKSTLFGDEKDRVLKKSDGAYTYFAVDIAYHADKIRRGYGHLINVWGADHHGYVQRVKGAIDAICSAEGMPHVRLTVILGQMVLLYKNGEPVKMSKRTGELITLDEVIDEIGADATRFFLMEKNPDTHLDFDLELAKKKSAENPVYYIQYAHARICSMLSKLGGDYPDASGESPDLDPVERELVLTAASIYDVVYDSAQTLQGQKVPQFLLQLARSFHSFYQHCPILSEERAGVRHHRIQIILGVREILRYGLNLMGISAPDVM